MIVGAGLFGCVCARTLTDAGKRCLVIEKRRDVGGNCATRKNSGITEHLYGPHIFHTNEKSVWEYVNQYVKLIPAPDFSPIANYNGEIYNLPFNMNTFARIYGVATPDEARKKIEKERGEMDGTPTNLKEQAISLVGRTIFEKLIKGYTEKQWGRKCEQLPPDIISRLPVRYTYDNRYYNDTYIGIPAEGYTRLFEGLLEGVEVRTSADFFKDKQGWEEKADRIIFTGEIDRYFGYKLGRLEYRSLRFETEYLETHNAQGCAVMNWTSADVPYTRTIEHKHFDLSGYEYWGTLLTREYPQAFTQDVEPYYSVNDAANNALYAQYSEMAAEQGNILFGGRLGSYQYADMDDTIIAALHLCSREIIG